MKPLKRISLLLFVASFIIGGAACSSKDKEQLEVDLGSATLTVTGDVQGSFSGMADFHALSTNQSDTWSISMHDYNPQNFSLNFVRTGKGVERPEVGTYTIGASHKADFFATFVHIVGQNFTAAKEYSTLEDPSGTLTIQTSNSQSVIGDFDLTAFEYNDNFEIVGSVHIKGSFNANQRR